MAAAEIQQFGVDAAGTCRFQSVRAPAEIHAWTLGRRDAVAYPRGQIDEMLRLAGQLGSPLGCAEQMPHFPQLCGLFADPALDEHGGQAGLLAHTPHAGHVGGIRRAGVQYQIGRLLDQRLEWHRVAPTGQPAGDGQVAQRRAEQRPCTVGQWCGPAQQFFWGEHGHQHAGGRTGCEDPADVCGGRQPGTAAEPGHDHLAGGRCRLLRLSLSLCPSLQPRLFLPLLLPLPLFLFLSWRLRLSVCRPLFLRLRRGSDSQVCGRDGQTQPGQQLQAVAPLRMGVLVHGGNLRSGRCH